MTIEHFVGLACDLSKENIMNGDPVRLLELARPDPYFGTAFADTTNPIVSPDAKNRVEFVILQHTDFTLVISSGIEIVIQNWGTD